MFSFHDVQVQRQFKFILFYMVKVSFQVSLRGPVKSLFSTAEKERVVAAAVKTEFPRRLMTGTKTTDGSLYKLDQHYIYMGNWE